MDAWKTRFLLGPGLFSGAMLVLGSVNAIWGSVLVHQLLQKSGSCHQDRVPVPSNRQCLFDVPLLTNDLSYIEIIRMIYD